MAKATMEVVLTIVVVAYKSRDEIRTCLGSLPCCLQGRSVDVIVIENGSGDGIGDLISKEYPWVVYLESEENLGFGKANNLAYELARGEFVLFLNPDTISNEAAYLHCLRRLQSETNIGVISPKLVMLDGEMDLACRRSIPTVWDGFCRALGLSALFAGSRLFAGYNLTYLPDEGTYEVGSVNGAFMMCPRRVLQRVGVFDEQFFMYGDDLDLNYRIRKAGYRVVYDGRVQIVHIKGVSSSKEPEKMAKAVFLATKQFYLKHFNPHGSRLVRWKYDLMFGAWSILASLRARLRGYRKARPL
jgi:GT2 family glycosyltransferase